MEFSFAPIFRRFIQIGYSQEFNQLELLHGCQELHDAYRSGVNNELFEFARKLSQSDLFALVRTLTIYELKQNGSGYDSTSPVIRLYEFCHDSDRQLADWILKHTNNEYLPFGGGRLKWNRGAKSIEEYDRIIALHTEARNLSLEAQKLREQMDQEASRARTIPKASHDIYNAVIRGDENAVDALIAKGARITDQKDKDGQTLLDIASKSGNENIFRSISIALERNYLRP